MTQIQGITGINGKQRVRRSRSADLLDLWRRYRRNRAAVFGLATVVVFVAVALAAPVLSPFDPLRVRSGSPFSPISLRNLMGTDDLGRDLFSGVVYGARISMVVGFLAAATATVIGVVVGAVSGYFGGRIDDILMRVTELFLVIPVLILAIVIVAIFGPSLVNIIFVIGILTWPAIARVARAEFLALREQEFIEAARSLGDSDVSIVFTEILPNALPPILVTGSLRVASAILMEAGMSFLGLGDPGSRSLGLMLNDALPLFRTAWWTAVFPGLAISLITLGFNLLGDGLNDALNPRLKER